MESDVYSYGMVVWHIFSRSLPWDGKRMTDPQVMKLTVMNKKVCQIIPYGGKIWQGF